MEYTISVLPGGQQFICRADQPILSAAIAANVLMPYSCRAGQCGSCQGQIDEGQIDYPKGFPEAITEQQHEQGEALFCSIWEFGKKRRKF